MSEHQYYEFQAVDRPLSGREMADLRTLSSRATITSTRLVNVYNWGAFRGNPAALMETLFDAFMYTANWGTRQLMLRLPRRLLDLPTATRYCAGDDAQARAAGDYIIVEYLSEQEPDDEVDDDEGWMPALLPLRAELADGDLRGLYLDWLLCAQSGALDDDAVEPPPPPGLATPSASQQALADFLRLNDDLLAVAAEHTPLRDETHPSRQALERWLGGLAESEKTALLLRLVEGGDPHLRSALLQRFRAATRATAEPDREGGGETGRRTVGQLLADAEQRADARRRAEAERAAREQARRARERAAARAERLAHLAAHEAEAWQRVDALIATKRPADYDEAVRLLVDLRDLHAQSGRSAAFATRLGELREQHARKPSFVQRLDRAGLGAQTGKAMRNER